MLYISHRDAAFVKFNGTKEQWLAIYGADLKFLGFLAGRLYEGLASGWSRAELEASHSYFTLKDYGWKDNLLINIPAFTLYSQYFQKDCPLEETCRAMNELACLQLLP